jgi:hypothetical protein
MIPVRYIGNAGRMTRDGSGVSCDTLAVYRDTQQIMEHTPGVHA